MAGVFSNNIQLGVPIAISLLGKESLPSIAVIFSLNGFLMWTLATIAIELGRNGYQIRDYQLTITGGKDIDFSPIRIVCCKHQEFNAKAEEAVTGDLRIIPMGNTFIVELTYRVGKDECKNSRSVALNPMKLCAVI